jgi:catechol 2,3-dioxygenase
MPTAPIWPARLHHVQIHTQQLAEMAAFYQRTFGYHLDELGESEVYLAGDQRRLLLSTGPKQALRLGAWTLESPEHLKALRKHVRALNIPLQAAPTPLLREGAFAVEDPDGRLLCFGLAEPEPPRTDTMPARLQHVVVTTLDTPRIAAFYTEALGFQISDRVLEGGALTTVFLRSDPDHHSFAAFRAPEVRLDHHSLEVPDWNAIRDWADHCAKLEIPLAWGPGRHGPGNNLFFMVSDPDGNWTELSAELEQMPLGMPGRDWPHTERTLNLWGRGILRS